MKTICESFFRIGLLAFPRAFRSGYGSEMLDVFRERVATLSTLAAFSEALDAVSAGARMRLEGAHARRVLVVTLATAMLVTSFALHNAGFLSSNRASGRIDFHAEDPAGAFTLTVIDGRPVGATLNKIPVSPGLIVTRADSISILRPDGLRELTVAFDAATRRITWEPRPPHDGRALR